ncbi:MAG: CtsR family transcriptional regulator [Clostridia bacterium]|nr:CtsR family transcriptional regulator [Clostridia bacterium]
MNLSKEIADLIVQMLGDTGTAEIRRNDLAEQIGCVPSQINYVLSSRFTPENGYIVESRRGGGGYIKITRATYNYETLKMHLINSIGDKIDEKACRANLQNLHARGLLSDQEVSVMYAALRDNTYRDLPPDARDRVRASIFKQMLLATMQ